MQSRCRFYRAKKDVVLLARGDWAKTIGENGLCIKDKLRFRKSVSRIPVITGLCAEDEYDVIFVVVRYTQLESVIDTLHENRSKNIVFVGNNVRASYYASLLPEKNVMFAFASSAGHREMERVVSIDLKKITIGQLKGTASNEEFITRIFAGMRFKVRYEPNMEDYLLCHAAFILPMAFACYDTDGDLRKIKRNTTYLKQILTAHIEGYRTIEKAGHEIIPASDKNYESDAYQKNCMKFFHLMCATVFGKICVSDHAMSAIEEMSALNRDMKVFFDENGAQYPGWKSLEMDNVMN